MVSETGKRLLVALERERHQDIEVVVDNAESARHDTDNRARLGIDDDGAADDRTIAAESPLPVSIAEHDVLWTIRDLIGCGELPASKRGNAERLENSVGDQDYIHF